MGIGGWLLMPFAHLGISTVIVDGFTLDGGWAYLKRTRDEEARVGWERSNL